MVPLDYSIVTMKCHYWLKIVQKGYNSTMYKEPPDSFYSMKFVSHAEETDLSKYNYLYGVFLMATLSEAWHYL